jgi:hypothetical protein
MPKHYPLVGVLTGAANGFDCLDIDPAGGGWYDRNFDALPLTRAHATRRDGVHLLFKHAEGLRGSAGKIAPGVDVRADGNYIIWWPRQGLPFEDHPISEWPNWLLEEAMAPSKLGTDKDHVGGGGMGYVGAIGAARIGSSISQRAFAALANATAIHAPLEHGPYQSQWSGQWKPRRTLPGKAWSRIEQIARKVERAERGNRNACLYWGACTYREMIDEGVLSPGTAEVLLIQAARDNGLAAEDGIDQVRATIQSAFRHVEEKLALWRSMGAPCS